jgi:nucleotide-binding universal stress UspA family protein
VFDRLLVATDFSVPSEAALKHARIIAKVFGGSIHVLHVLPNVFLRAMVTDVHALDTGAIAQLRDWVRDGDTGGATVSVTRSDDPADEIVGYARSNGFDLIVMGTHGRSGVAHVLMGSVAERVVRTASCPVLTVHTPPGGELTRILVPTDFSAAADAALDAARAIADRFGATIHLLHVMHEPAESGAEMYVPETPEARAERLRDAMDRLGHRLGAADESKRRGGHTEVMSGAPADAIVERARHFDLVVMGTHGRRGMAHVLMGSVAERVVRQAQCPVITVRQLMTDGLEGAAGREPTGSFDWRPNFSIR